MPVSNKNCKVCNSVGEVPRALNLHQPKNGRGENARKKQEGMQQAPLMPVVLLVCARNSSLARVQPGRDKRCPYGKLRRQGKGHSRRMEGEEATKLIRESRLKLHMRSPYTPSFSSRNSVRALLVCARNSSILRLMQIGRCSSAPETRLSFG